MRREPSFQNEIYVHLVPAPEPEPASYMMQQSRAPTGEATTAYDAYIYTRLHLDGLSPPHPDADPQRLKFRDLPCVAVEQIVVRWSRYHDYLGAFMEGMKDPWLMRQRLLETMSPGLERLFSGEPITDGIARVWWHSAIPELEDLPWELIAYRHSDATHAISFVRGAPPSPATPMVPLAPDTPLRLGYIHAGQGTPAALEYALHDLPPGVELVDLGGDPRRALRTAVSEGVELLHLVTDGFVSLAYEGILYLPQEDPALPGVEIAAGELSRQLAGSRVSLISLTEPRADVDMIPIGRYQVPSAYRAFAYLARSDRPLPNVIAPLGPTHEDMVHRFWNAFYWALAQSLSVEQAAAVGRREALAPMALFLRQNLRQTFRRVEDVAQVPAIDPSQLSSELNLSYEAVSEFESLAEQVDELPKSVREFLSEESARQERLESDLDPWLGSEDWP